MEDMSDRDDLAEFDTSEEAIDSMFESGVAVSAGGPTISLPSNAVLVTPNETYAGAPVTSLPSPMFGMGSIQVVQPLAG